MSAKSDAKSKIGSDQAAGGAKKQQKPNIQVTPKPCSITKTSQNAGNRNKSQVVEKMQENRLQQNQVAKNNNKYRAVKRVPHIELVPQRAEAQQLPAEENRNEAPSEAGNLNIADNSSQRVPIIVEEEVQREEIVDNNTNTTVTLISSSSTVRPRRIRPLAQRHVNNNFQCYICKCNVRNAVITICGHLYCWPCLWAFERPRLGCACCPHCRRGVQIHEDIVPYFGSIIGEDDDTVNATITDGGDIVLRPSAFRVKTSVHGCPWFLTESLVPREINTVPRRRQHNFSIRFNGNIVLTRIFDLLINMEFCLVFLIILALKFLCC